MTSSGSPRADFTLQINPQRKSPLYNGRIPSEIRIKIYDYALTEPPIAIMGSKYRTPVHSRATAMAVPLLRTCQRIFLETHHLPSSHKHPSFWHFWSCPDPQYFPYHDNEDGYFARLTTWQRPHVTNIHIFPQMFWLESEFLDLCKQDFMQSMQHVKLTIRRGDWWWYESNEPLSINPQRGDGNVQQMVMDWQAEA